MNFPDALAAVQATYAVLAGALAARDDAKVKAAMADLQQQLWEASSINLSQLQLLHRLELETQELRVQAANAVRDLEDVKAKAADEAKYHLAEVRTGVWARVLVEDIEKPVERRPNFCPTCYTAGRKTPLQYREAETGVPNRLHCPVQTGHTLTLGGELPLPPAPDSWY